MLARSSVLAIALACGGCDLVFGVGGDEQPCELAPFDGAHSVDITPAVSFSIDWDQKIGVMSDNDGLSREITLPDGKTTSEIDLGSYTAGALALAPEGNALFYTGSIEPPLLEGALRRGPGTWQLDAEVPRGTFAGTPSADVLGPRRVLVKLRATDLAIQEYEDQAGHWVAIGAPHMVPSDQAPNLTPNGLTAVYSTSDADLVGHHVWGMTRASTQDWFGEPVQILANDQSPQLLGKCKELYTVHEGVLRRYDR